VVEKILQDAAKKIIEIPPGQIKTLEQILEIISRGGTLAILIVNELLDPREAGAGSERMLPPVPPLGCRKDRAY
jgi:hypothetical protein